MSKNQQPSRGPDYGIAKILRGFTDFEDYYQGLSRGTPIALSPWGSRNQGRDAVAKSNYDALSSQLAQQTASVGPPADASSVDGATSPELLEGLSLTLGANVVFAFPVNANAVYKITWRLRTADFYAASRQPYHSVLQGYRYADTAVSTQNGKDADTVYAGKAAARAVVGSWEENIRITQAPPTGSPELGQQVASDFVLNPAGIFQFTETITVGELAVATPISPILPFVGGNAAVNPVTGKTYVPGEYGQSPLVKAINDGSEGGTAMALQNRTAITHVTYTTRAKADECVVTVFPEAVITSPDSLGTYDFDADDQFLSLCFGRGGYEGPFNASGPLFPQGIPYGVYVIQGYD